MPVWKKKKIIFIGNQFPLLNILSKENETEVVSSINFLENLVMQFAPDLIVSEPLSQKEIMHLRKIPRLAFVPILETTEKFTPEETNSAESFSNVILCNSSVCCTPSFVKHLYSIMERTVSLVPAKTGAIVKNAILFLDMNFDRKITRKTISQTIAADEDYLTRIFKREMGMGLWDYLTKLRLEEARNLLTYTGLSIKEISQKCGFNAQAYFCNCFKKEYNLSPGDIRNNR